MLDKPPIDYDALTNLDSSNRVANFESNKEGEETVDDVGESGKKISRPALLDEDGGQSANSTPVSPNMKQARERIADIISEKSQTVRAGPQYAIVREMPTWKSAQDLRAAASRPINWAVKNLWTERGKILLAAEQKAGKTFVICHVAMCYASGLPMFGHERFKMMDPGPVGIIAGEDDEAEIGRRLDRMFRAKGMLMSDYPVHFASGHNLRLNRQKDQDFIRNAVRQFKLRLVIYDPLARLMDGDENSKEIVSAVLNPASAMAIEENVSVMVVHHLGKQSTDTPRTAIARVRGSSDITSWFSCGMFLSGNMRLGRVNLEVVQRTSGDVPNEFPVDVKEDQDQSIYGLGTMRLLANLDKDEKAEAGRNEQMVDEAANSILDLVRRKAEAGVTRSEISVHLGYGTSLTNAALKRLVREDRAILFEEVDDLPEKQVIKLRAAPGRANVIPLPTNYQDAKDAEDDVYPSTLDLFPEDEEK